MKAIWEKVWLTIVQTMVGALTLAALRGVGSLVLWLLSRHKRRIREPSRGSESADGSG